MLLDHLPTNRMTRPGSSGFSIDHQASFREHRIRNSGHHRNHGIVSADGFLRFHHSPGHASSLTGQSRTFNMSKPSNILDSDMRAILSTITGSSRPQESHGMEWAAAYGSAASSGGQNVINYDVDEDDNGNTAIKFLTTSTSSVPTSSMLSSGSAYHPGVGSSVGSGLLYDSASLLVNTNWSSNVSAPWDTTALPEPEKYNVPRLSAEIQVALYSIIFSTALVGNLLIIVTLIQNKRMRTVTNVFLLNLAVSDLLLALVCMPFTLVPMLLKDFIFGAFMCVFIRYLQGE